LRSELVVRSPRGRKMTSKAFDHLGLKAVAEPEPGQQGKLFE